MEEVGFQEVETYISRCHNTVAQLIFTGPIIYLCLAADSRLGSRVYKQWWEQEGLDLEAYMGITSSLLQKHYGK